MGVAAVEVPTVVDRARGAGVVAVVVVGAGVVDAPAVAVGAGVVAVWPGTVVGTAGPAGTVVVAVV